MRVGSGVGGWEGGRRGYDCCGCCGRRRRRRLLRVGEMG